LYLTLYWKYCALEHRDPSILQGPVELLFQIIMLYANDCLCKDFYITNMKGLR